MNSRNQTTSIYRAIATVFIAVMLFATPIQTAYSSGSDSAFCETCEGGCAVMGCDMANCTGNGCTCSCQCFFIVVWEMGPEGIPLPVYGDDEGFAINCPL